MMGALEQTLYVDWDLAKDVAGTIQGILEEFNLEYLMQNDRFLDIGCGDGKIIHELQKLYPTTQMYGLDRSSDAVEMARQNNPGADIRMGDFGSISFEDGMFNGCFSNNIFEYSKERDTGYNTLFLPSFRTEDLAKEVYRILKKGGIYFIHEPLENSEAKQFRIAGFSPVDQNQYFNLLQK